LRTAVPEHSLKRKIIFSLSMKTIYGPKRQNVTGWNKMHNEELHNLYTSINIIREVTVARVGKEKVVPVFN